MSDSPHAGSHVSAIVDISRSICFCSVQDSRRIVSEVAETYVSAMSEIAETNVSAISDLAETYVSAMSKIAERNEIHSILLQSYHTSLTNLKIMITKLIEIPIE